MPPIPVHIDDPIAPKNAQSAPSPTSPAANEIEKQDAPYPAARPGAAAVPAPTPFTAKPQPAPSKTVPRSIAHDGPPPPQPGAVPVLQPQQIPGTALPPPPGRSPLQGQAQITSMPNQMDIPPPQQNNASTRSTTTADAKPVTAQLGPTTLNYGPVLAGGGAGGGGERRASSDQHPSGYQQNIYAQELNPAQRASLDQDARRGSTAAQFGLTGGEDGGGVSETAGKVWEGARGWLNVAGQKLAETEEQVWRRINGH